MHQQKTIRVLACVIIAGLLLGMPAYIMIQSSLFSSGENDVIVDSMEDLELGVPLYGINMDEDSISTILLTDYFYDSWDEVYVYVSNNFSYFSPFPLDNRRRLRIIRVGFIRSIAWRIVDDEREERK